MPNLIKDFPVEIFRSKNEIIQELIIISKKQDNEIPYYTLQCLRTIIKRIGATLTSVGRVHYKNVNTTAATNSFLKEDREFIKHSYPCLDESKFSETSTN